MVATGKAESKNEAIWEKVRARALVMTDSGEWTVAWWQQIAKLMATLTQACQGISPSSVPSSPQERVMEGDAIVVAPQVAQTPTMVGVALDR